MCPGYNYIMANEQDVQRVKDLTENGGMTEEDIKKLLDAGQTVREICHDYWTRKATTYSTMVNVSESGSSRNMGDLYKNALAIADRFAPLESIAPKSAMKMSRKAVRG